VVTIVKCDLCDKEVTEDHVQLQIYSEPKDIAEFVEIDVCSICQHEFGVEASSPVVLRKRWLTLLKETLHEVRIQRKEERMGAIGDEDG
jgi:hypothetical protein